MILINVGQMNTEVHPCVFIIHTVDLIYVEFDRWKKVDEPISQRKNRRIDVKQENCAGGLI